MSALHNLNLSDLMNTAHSDLVAALDYASRLARHAETVNDQLTDEPEIGFIAQIQSNHPDVARLARESFSIEVSRYSLLLMMAHWERYLLELTVLKALAEQVATSGGSTLVDEAFTRRDEIMQRARTQSVDGLMKDLVGDSEALLTAEEWFRGLYKIRLCLVHRAGIVAQQDKELIAGIAWRLMVLLKDGEEFPEGEQSPRFEKGQTISPAFKDRQRSWALGAHVTFTAVEVQEMAFSMLICANRLLKHVHAEGVKIIHPSGDQHVQA